MEERLHYLTPVNLPLTCPHWKRWPGAVRRGTLLSFGPPWKRIVSIFHRLVLDRSGPIS
jgi:hypothetical protein